MYKTLIIFGLGIVTGILLLAVQATTYRNNVAAKNEQLKSRIGELETLLADALAERPEFVSVPTQTDRENLEFPDPLPNIANLTSSQLDQIATNSPTISDEFLSLFNTSAQQNDLITNQLLNNITPAMKAVQDQALSGNFVGFFQLLERARLEVARLRTTVNAAVATNEKLAAHSQTPVLSDQVAAAVAVLTGKNSEYYAILYTFLDQLDQTLNGAIPSQQLLDEIGVSNNLINTHGRGLGVQYAEVANLITPTL